MESSCRFSRTKGAETDTTDNTQNLLESNVRKTSESESETNPSSRRHQSTTTESIDFNRYGQETAIMKQQEQPTVTITAADAERTVERRVTDKDLKTGTKHHKEASSQCDGSPAHEGCGEHMGETTLDETCCTEQGPSSPPTTKPGGHTDQKLALNETKEKALLRNENSNTYSDREDGNEERRNNTAAAPLGIIIPSEPERIRRIGNIACEMCVGHEQGDSRDENTSILVPLSCSNAHAKGFVGATAETLKNGTDNNEDNALNEPSRLGTTRPTNATLGLNPNKQKSPLLRLIADILVKALTPFLQPDEIAALGSTCVILRNIIRLSDEDIWQPRCFCLWSSLQTVPALTPKPRPPQPRPFVAMIRDNDKFEILRRERMEKARKDALAGGIEMRGELLEFHNNHPDTLLSRQNQRDRSGGGGGSSEAVIANGFGDQLTAMLMFDNYAAMVVDATPFFSSATHNSRALRRLLTATEDIGGGVGSGAVEDYEQNNNEFRGGGSPLSQRRAQNRNDNIIADERKTAQSRFGDSDDEESDSNDENGATASSSPLSPYAFFAPPEAHQTPSETLPPTSSRTHQFAPPPLIPSNVRIIGSVPFVRFVQNYSDACVDEQRQRLFSAGNDANDLLEEMKHAGRGRVVGGGAMTTEEGGSGDNPTFFDQKQLLNASSSVLNTAPRNGGSGPLGSPNDQKEMGRRREALNSDDNTNNNDDDLNRKRASSSGPYHTDPLMEIHHKMEQSLSSPISATGGDKDTDIMVAVGERNAIAALTTSLEQQNVAPATSLPLTKKVLRKFAAINKSSLTLVQREEASRSLFASKQRLLEANHKRQMQRQEGGAKEHSKRKNGGEESTFKAHKYSQKQKKVSQLEEKDRHSTAPGIVGTSNSSNPTTAHGDTSQPQDVSQRVFSRRGVPQNDKNKQTHVENAQRNFIGADACQMENGTEGAGDAEDAIKSGSPDRSQALLSPAEDYDDVGGRDEDDDQSHHHQPQTDADPDPDAGNDHHQNEDDTHADEDDTHHENWFQEEADRESACGSDITLWSTSNGSLERELNHEYQQLLLNEQQEQQELEELMRRLKEARSARNRRLRRKKKQQHQRPRMSNEKENENESSADPRHLNTIDSKDRSMLSHREHLALNPGTMNTGEGEGEEDEMPHDDDHHGDDDEYDDFHDDDDDEQQMINAENEVMGKQREEEEEEYNRTSVGDLGQLIMNVTSKAPTLTTSMAASPSAGGENDLVPSKVLPNKTTQQLASPATNMLSSSSSTLINPNMINNNNNRGPPSPTLRWCDLSANTQRLVALEYADINNKNGTSQDQPANNVCAVTGRRQRTHRSSRSGHSNRSVVSLQSLANSNKGKGGIALAPAVVEQAKAIIGEHVPSHLDNGVEGLSYGGAMMVPSRSASAVNTPQVLPMSGRIEMKRMCTDDNMGEKIPSFSLPPADSPSPAVMVVAGSAHGESSTQPKKRKKRGGSSSRASSRSRRSATTAATETLANEEETELSGGEESSRRAHPHKSTAKTIKKSEKTKSKSSSQGGDGESVLMKRRRKRKRSHRPSGACSSRKTVDTEATNTENLSSSSSSVGDDERAPPRNSRTMSSSSSASSSSSSSNSGEEEETATRVTQSIAEFSSSSDDDGSYESDTESSSSEEGSGSGSSSESESESGSFSSEEDEDEESSEGEDDRGANSKGRSSSTNQPSLVMISSNVAEGYGAYDSDATLDDEDLSSEQIENLKRMYDKVIRMIVGDKKKRPCLLEPPGEEEGEELMGKCLKGIEAAENDLYPSLAAAVVHENDNKLTIRKSHSRGWVAQRSALKTSSTTSAIDSYARTWALNNQHSQNELQRNPMQRLELQQQQASQRKHAKQNESAEIKPANSDEPTALIDVRDEPPVSGGTKHEPLSSLVIKSPHLKVANHKTTQSPSNSALFERRSISPKPSTVLGAEEGEEYLHTQQERPPQIIATPRTISGCSALCIATCDGAGGEKHHHHPKCSRHVTISQESVALHDARHLQHLQRKAVAMVSAMDSDGFVPKVILRAVDSVSNASTSMTAPHSTTVDLTAAVDESRFSLHNHGSGPHSVAGSVDGSGTSVSPDPSSATSPPTNPMASSATVNKIVTEQKAFIGSSITAVAGVSYKEISGGQPLATSTAASTSSQPIIINSGVPPPPSSSVVATVVEVLLENPHLVTDTTATVEGRLGLITTHQKEREGQHGPLSGLDATTAAAASGSGATLRGGPHEPSLSLAQSGGGALPNAVVGRSPYALAGPQHTQNGNSKSAARKPAPPMISQIPAPSAAFFEWLNTATAALPVSTILGAVDRGIKDKERVIGGINVKASVGSGLSQQPSTLQAPTGPKDPLAPIVAAHLSARMKTTVDSHVALVVSNSGATDSKDDTNINMESGIESRSTHLEQLESVSHAPPRVLFLPSSRVAKTAVDFALSPDEVESPLVHKNISPNQADSALSSLIVSQKEASKLDVASNNKFEGEEVTVDENDANDEDDDEWYRPLAQRSMKNVAEQLGLWKHAYVCSIKDATQTCLSKEEILHINWEMTITAPTQLPPVLRSAVTPPLNPMSAPPANSGGGAAEVPPHFRKVPISFDTDGMARCDIFPPMHYQVVSNGKEVSLGHLQRLPVYRGPINANTMKGPKSQKPAPRPMGSGASGVGIFANLVRRSQEQNSTNNNARASPSPQTGRSLFGNVGSRNTPQTATSTQHASAPADPPPPPPLTYRTHVPLWSVNLEEKANRQRELRDMDLSHSEATTNSLSGVSPTPAAYSFTDRWCWTVGNNTLAIASVDIPRPEYVNLLMQHGA